MEIVLTVDAGPDADDAETAELAARLREELATHDVDSVSLPAAPPSGAKGVGEAVGSLLVVVGASGGVLTTLVGMLQAWLLRQSGGKLLVEIDGDRIELTGATDEERRRALDTWLARHGADNEGDADRGGGSGT